MKCKWHCCNNNLLGNQRKFCSINCKSKYYVTLNRKTTKQKAVNYKGGKCSECGYCKSIHALCFHHLYEKDFGISQSGITRSWAKTKQELDKCVLVCLNCHAEIHSAPRVKE